MISGRAVDLGPPHQLEGRAGRPREPAADENDVDFSQARAMLLSYMQALLKEFNSRRGDGSGTLKYKTVDFRN